MFLCVSEALKSKKQVAFQFDNEGTSKTRTKMQAVYV